MLALINSDDRRVNIALAILSWAILAGCLAYNVYLIWATPNPGLTYDARWEVTAVDACDAATETCPDVEAIQEHDVLVSVGGITFDDFTENPNLVPFEGFLPGDTVPLTVSRNSQTFEIDWLMKPVKLATIARFSVISLLVYGSFWLAGTFVLRFLRPADLVWILLISLFYLTTIWLAVGLFTLSNVANSALILRVVGWLMVPVLVHLHLVVPCSKLPPRWRLPVVAMYIVAIGLLLLQLAGLLPWFAYLGGILLASLISIILLTYRAFTPRAPSEKLTAKLLLAGIVLALVPGLVLSVIPLLLNVGTSDAVGAALSILALPMLPLFYTYAIYKHRLGLREHRINRLLVQYVLFLLYFILLTLVFVIMSNWIWTANTLLAIGILVALALIVALLPIRRPVQAVFDRLAYGTRYSQREILGDFADRIPAAVDRQDLVQLLKYELAPEMEIRQSALFVRQEESVTPLYWQGVGLNEGLRTWDETQAILGEASHFIVTKDMDIENLSRNMAWVRLVIPLRVKGRPTGAWLFGRRESDDIYSQDDIDLLDRLSNLVAVTLDSSQLVDALSAELAMRTQTEAQLAEQSERLRILHEIDRAILAAGPPAEIARAAFTGIRQLVPCIRVSVFLLDDDQGTMKILAAQGSGTDIVDENSTVSLTAAPAFKTLLQGKLFVNDDVQKGTDVSGLGATLALAGIRAVVSAPLMASGTVFGALSVANAEPSSYTPAHVSIIEEVATSVALAIHNARLREEVNSNSEELQLLSARLIDAQETERKRLSHELHDEMGQILTAISLSLAAVERNLPDDASGPLGDRLEDANALVLDLTDQVRSLSLELRPSMLHDLGLISTLRWYVANYLRRSDAAIDFSAGDLPDRLPENVEIAAYRVVQEALTNTSRHSGATQIDLSVEGINGHLQIVIQDNGRGFDPDLARDGVTAASGLGLVTMRERISALNGRLAVQSQPGNGTRVSAEIPIEENA